MPDLLAQDVRQHLFERLVAAILELFELIAAHAVHQEAEHRDVTPGRHAGPESLDVALAAWPPDDPGGVVPEVVEQPIHLAEVVDLFCRRLAHLPEILRRRRAVADPA